MDHKQAFTLIELLIVVAIIGILAAIAVPNFLQAQIRAKIAKAQSEMNTWVKTYELYRLDNNTFPPHFNGHPVWQNKPLTTPIAYVNAIPRDPFQTETAPNQGTLQWSHGEYHAEFFPQVSPIRVIQDPALYQLALQGRLTHNEGGTHIGTVYYVWSMGPDHAIARNNLFDIYHPSNGLTSNGDIVAVKN